MIATQVPTTAAEAADFTGMTFPHYKHLTAVPSHLDITPLLVTATVDDVPAGLALGAIPKPGYQAPPTLFSLYTAPAFRHQGVGTRLMEVFHHEVAARGGELIRTIYMTGKDVSAHFERILEKTGWEKPQPRMAAIKADLRQIRAMNPPWLQERRFDASRFSIVPWREITDAQKDALRRSHEADRWIAEDLAPWKHEANYDPVTSCAVLRDGALVSWVINHRLADGTTRFTCSFAHPRLQRYGVVMWLYKEAVDQMEKHNRRFGMWTVPLHHPAMHAFATRWMKPCAVYFRETMGCEKILTSDRIPV
ncbi:MAG: GCN5-related N-acetyltransferase [Verrucomicrobiales bacterium]|nr:GCN5-related N-acetyltransferase [Verrucomicrobiales bacterium]